MTCWLDTGQPDPDAPRSAEPFSVTITFTGKRCSVDGKAQPGDSFTQQQTVSGIVPGSGPAAVTTQVLGINPGQWAVTANAEPAAARVYQLPRNPGAGPGRGAAPLLRLAQRTCSGPVVTTTPPLAAKIPGAIRTAWAAMWLTGVLAGLTITVALMSASRLPAPPMGMWLSALPAGLVGAKGWYILKHHGNRLGGWSTAGGLAAGTVAAAAALWIAGLSAGTYLNLDAPGLLLGVAIGRTGCLLGGCCAGRPTCSRWGLWSSDRRLGIRRIPSQLLESLLALVSGLTALAVVELAPARPGAVFTGALAAYTLGRQFVLPLRAKPRRSTSRRLVTIAAAALVLAADIALAIAA